VTVLAAAAVSGLRQLTISSRPFDPEVTADCSAAPLAPAFGGFEDSLNEAAPYTAPRCQVEFKWVVLTHHSNGIVDARVDVGGDGVTQGWAVELDFAGVKALPMRAVAVSNLIGAVELSTSAGVVLVRPRLASGLGTVLLSVRLPRSWPDGRAPAIRCVREPPQAGGGAAETQTEEEAEAAWLGRAREDYSWMADEFNRQYHNSHGKSHDDYQPSSADSELQLHFLNGRLWCFYGAVHNATRSLRQAVALDPEHLLSHLLLAKVYIGQGFHRQALRALDEATRIQPHHWQSHLMRLFVLGRLGRLHTAEAAPSHAVTCTKLREACELARSPETFRWLCQEGRVQLYATDTAALAAPALAAPAFARAAPARAASARAAAPSAAAAGGEVEAGMSGDEGDDTTSGLYGAHLHSTARRRALQLDRYVVLFQLLPPPLLSLLRRFYSHLRDDVGGHAHFQQKTQRHEYFPEVLSTYLNFALVPFASRMSGQRVAPTYPFPITYVPGGGIHPHLDVSDNELSLTFQVHLEDAEVWPLTFLDPRGQELSSLDPTNASIVGLRDNDGILYYGPDIVHWRSPMEATLTQIVFAFREVDPSHCNNQ